jgi:hypothetical protein
MVINEALKKRWDRIKNKRYIKEKRTHNQKLLDTYKKCNACFNRDNTCQESNKIFIDTNYKKLLPYVRGDRLKKGKEFMRSFYNKDSVSRSRLSRMSKMNKSQG